MNIKNATKRISRQMGDVERSNIKWKPGNEPN